MSGIMTPSIRDFAKKYLNVEVIHIFESMNSEIMVTSTLFCQVVRIPIRKNLSGDLGKISLQKLKKVTGRTLNVCKSKFCLLFFG